MGANGSQEDMIDSYEKKTGIPRENILDWETDVEISTREYNSPKWLLPVIDTINKGAECIGKSPFVFSSSQFTTIGKWVKEIIGKRDGDSDDRCMEAIINSIKWKSSQAAINDNDKKFYTKGFFSRTTKNNLASNLYHYEEYRKGMACPTEQKFPKKKASRDANKKVMKKEPVVFDYGKNMGDH